MGRPYPHTDLTLPLFTFLQIPIDMVLDDGVRYLQWPLGSVSEQSRQCAEMARQGPALVYDDTPDGRGLGEVCARVVWVPVGQQWPRARCLSVPVDLAGPFLSNLTQTHAPEKQLIPTRWGEHYREMPRQPSEFDLAPWVKAYWNAGRKFGK